MGFVPLLRKPRLSRPCLEAGGKQQEVPTMKSPTVPNIRIRNISQALSVAYFNVEMQPLNMLPQKSTLPPRADLGEQGQCGKLWQYVRP